MSTDPAYDKSDLHCTDDEPITEEGAFGPIFREYSGKPAEAVAHLLKARTGEVPGALHHPSIGEIDLVWGEEGAGKSNGYGLAKIAKFHPEVLDELQDYLSEMHISSESANRYRLKSDTHEAAVSKHWHGNKKTWLLTEYLKISHPFPEGR